MTASAGPATDTELFTINVSNVDRPVDLAPIADVNVAEGAVAGVALLATDPDGDAISYSAVLPGFGTLAGNQITLAPGFSDAGVYPASATASTTGSSDTESFTIFVSNTNRPVDLAPIANLTVAEGAVGVRNISASDPDGDAISLTAVLPAFASLVDNGDGTGSVTASPAFGDAGSYPASATANSADGTSDTESFSIIVTNVNQAPTLDQPADMIVDEGQVATQQLTASDPDGDALTYSKVGTTPFFMSVSAAGLVTLSPSFSDAGSYTGTARVSDGALSDTKSFNILVNNVNRCPVADANGPYSGVAGVPLTLDGSGSSDADGDVLIYSWDFGDGIVNGNQAMPQHTYAVAGVYNIILTVSDGQCSSTATSTATISDVFPAFAFTTGGNNKTSLGAGKPFTYVQIEPVNSSFTIPDVNLASIKMISVGTGSVSEIFADASKTVVDGDKNGNGVTEIRAGFSKADLRLLFSNLPNGNNNVTVTIEGDLVGGGRFQATLDHIVKGTGGALAANITRDRLSSQSTLTFHLSKPGAVKVQMFDISGRLIRTFLDESFAAAGYRDLKIDNLNANGTKVPSGVYFIKIASQHDGTESQKITFLK